MKIFKIIVFVLLLLLSVATGLVKVFKMETEMEIFRNAGFSDTMIIIFGMAQLVAGFLLLLPSVRKKAATALALTFSIATCVLFINGQMMFGIFSILFIAMTAWFIKTDIEIPNQV